MLGFDPARQPLKVKRRVGYLPDSVGFYDHLTAEENLAYTAKLMGLPLAERTQRIAHAGLATLAVSLTALWLMVIGLAPSTISGRPPQRIRSCSCGCSRCQARRCRPLSPSWASSFR